MKKLRSKKGFTLVEVLVATLILAIFVSMAIVGTSALFGTGEQMMAVSKAAVLGSDVMKAVTNEVRFGEGFSLDADTKVMKYKSTTYGEGCEMTLDDKGQLMIVQTSKGTDLAGEETSASKNFFPIGSAAYDEVRIKSIGFAIEEKKDAKGNMIRQSITCTLAITSDGENTLWNKTVTVVPLYQKALA